MGCVMNPHTLRADKLRSRWVLVFSGFLIATAIAFSIPTPATLGLGTALAIAFAVLLPAWTLYFYAASLFLFHVPLFTVLPVAVPTAAGFFFIASAFLQRLMTRSRLHIRSVVPRLLGVMVLIVLVSALTNPDWFDSHPRGVTTYLALFASAVAIGLLIRKEKEAWIVANIFVFGANLISAVAIYETWTGHYNVIGLFEGESDRAYALADPNYTAALLVTLAPFLVAMFVCGRSPLTRLWASVSLALACLTIAMTASRGGVIGIVLTGVAIFVLVSSRRGRNSSLDNSRVTLRRSSPGRLRVLIVLVLGLGAAAALAPTIMWDRLARYEDWSDPHKESRLRLWDEYLGEWRGSPWWGHGPSYVEEGQELYHNTPLQILIEFGAFGLLTFLAVNASAFREALRARKRYAQKGGSEMAILSGATAAALIGFHTTAFFLTSGSHKELWFLIGFAAALHHLSSGSNAPTLSCVGRE